MTAREEQYTAALAAAAEHARQWLASVPNRPVPPRRTADVACQAGNGQLPQDFPAVTCGRCPVTRWWTVRR
ncbi:MAG TPA: hypothetical protein VFN75_12225 [Pseudonocardiaceae bacterium]|nr:hypothetical protein [Pseudonocardiaceae bacterium]